MRAAQESLAEGLPAPARTKHAAHSTHEIDLLEVRSRERAGVDAEVRGQPPGTAEWERGGNVGALEVGLPGAQERVGRGYVRARLARRGRRTRAGCGPRPGHAGEEQDHTEDPTQPQPDRSLLPAHPFVLSSGS